MYDTFERFPGLRREVGVVIATGTDERKRSCETIANAGYSGVPKGEFDVEARVEAVGGMCRVLRTPRPTLDPRHEIEAGETRAVRHCLTDLGEDAHGVLHELSEAGGTDYLAH